MLRDYSSGSRHDDKVARGCERERGATRRGTDVLLLGKNIFTSDSQWIHTRDMMGR